MQVSRICSDLVTIKSENPPGETADVIEYIRAFLEKIGICQKIYADSNGACNLVSEIPQSRLLLCGHVDVVPARDEGWTHPPFSGDIDDTYVWGRGSTDMKGGCAAILSACETRVNRGLELPASLAFVCDEETGGEMGIRHILARNALHPCDCVIAEPTPALHPSIGQKGLCRLEIGFSGTPAHGSLYPAVGVSAIVEAMSLIGYMKELSMTDYPVDEHIREIIEDSGDVLSQEFNIGGVRDVLKRLTYNPGVIHGGEKSNVVAQHCDLDLECRVPWGCNIPDLLKGIQDHAHRGKIISQETHEPSITDPLCPLVSVTCSEIKKVYGGTVFPIVQWAASDARHLRRHGFRVIEYGPGEISTLHAVNERVTIDSLEKASLIYGGIMQKYAEN
ncbi:M20/M25/M40 family metallo-hydrolase [uncultured Methanoregula sp.]|uniref:M20/M25/M40 family metallo-hydrolase n=1 Tax=uncultured Methanoregula sp. TaxID=1005933 RepID=UPI002AAA734F|nr:M20/M25/M40 family metallo-hydrolase [uncultured Methanoregula sp.]